MVTKGQVNETISALLDNAMEPSISVVGVGGAGCNVVSSLYDGEMHGLELVAVNTDRESLSRARADIKVLLDLPSHGVEHAEDAAEASRESLRRSLGTDVLFLVCGLGGATGTGAAPVVADAARENGAMVISIALMPFEAEGRSEIAERGLEALKECSDTILAVDNNNLLGFEELRFNEAMTVVNKMVATLIRTVVERLTSPVLSTFAEEVQTAAQEVGNQESEPVGIDMASPSGVEATPEFRPVGFDDRGFIGFA